MKTEGTHPDLQEDLLHRSFVVFCCPASHGCALTMRSQFSKVDALISGALSLIELFMLLYDTRT